MSRTAIALALCLLLAGCAAPTAPAETATPAADSPATATPADRSPETTTGTPTTDAATTDPDRTSGPGETTDEANDSALSDPDIAVSGGPLPVDHERVFVRTTDLLGVNVSPPSVVVVQSSAEIQSSYGGNSAGSKSGRRSFLGVMGIGRDDDGGSESDGDGGDDQNGSEGVSVAAYAPSPHSVFVNERMTAAGREPALERVLAHEYVHNVQFRQHAFRRVERSLDLQYGYSRDRYLTYVSVVEGTAVFVADAYDRRYLTGNWSSVSGERYRSAPSGVKYSIARYYFGGRYLAARYDSPSNVSQVYDDPPRTTEQLLHPDASPNRTEPADLSLFVRPGENRTRGQSDTNGELFTRIALGTQLNESRAAAGAAGWGGDSLASVTPENRTRNRSFVWATTWDSPAEAEEFADALDAYLSSRATRVERGHDERARNASAGDASARNATASLWRDGSLVFRTVRVSKETVVLLAGEEEFVRNATVSGTNSSVSVSAEK